MAQAFTNTLITPCSAQTLEDTLSDATHRAEIADKVTIIQGILAQVGVFASPGA